MVCSEKQTFGIADDNMHLGQSFGCLFGLSFTRLMTLNMGFNSVVAWVGITDSGGFLGEQPFVRRAVGLAAKIGQVLHAQTSRSSVLFDVVSRFALRARSALNGNQNGRGSLASSAAIEKVLLRILLFLVGAKKAIVELYCSIKFDRLIRLAHSQSNLLHHVPNRLIPLHSQSLLHVFCRNGLGGAHHQEHAAVPSVKRQLTVHHDSAASDGCFCTAIHAFPTVNRTDPTQLLRSTFSANEAVLLALCFHVADARCFIRELLKEVFRCHIHRIFSESLTLLSNQFTFYKHAYMHCIIQMKTVGESNSEKQLASKRLPKGTYMKK